MTLSADMFLPSLKKQKQQQQQKKTGVLKEVCILHDLHNNIILTLKFQKGVV